MRPALARSLAAVVTALALAACGAKGSDGGMGSDQAPAPGPSAAARSEPAARPAPDAVPAPAPPLATNAPAPPPAAHASFPEACGEYRRTIERFSACGDALASETRDHLRALFDRQWAQWEQLPEQDRRALAAICKSSSDTVREAAAAACGW